MTKTQKRILVTMAVSMLMVLGSLVTAVYVQQHNRVIADFQAQIDAQVAANQMKQDNVGILHK